ncbi:MAG: metallophosphoesterase [bacterium]|nr:metallophosphoesterase [bacterium]
MKIGIISDVHSKPERVAYGIQKLKDLGVERLILNGDIGEAGDLEESQTFSAIILETVGKSGLETYVQPGSHETISGYGTVIDLLSHRYENIVDMTREASVDIAGHRLLFLPGSDVNRGGEYHLGTDLPSGRYAFTEDGLVGLENFSILQKLVEDRKVQRLVEYKNIQDLVPLIKNPEKSIVICHIPARFNVGAQGVDFAYFATSPSDGFVPGMVIEGQIQELFSRKEGREARPDEIDSVAQANGFTFHKENVGNVALRTLLDDNSIQYAINGHIHETGHHAHNRKGQAVAEYLPASELFWNSGCFDQGQMGILSIDDSGVAYQNVKL